MTMAQLGNFNPDQVQDDARELLPPGQYVAQIIESDVVATKSGSGQMLKLTFEIVDGPLTKRRIWENLNIQNQNAVTQDIAQKSLKRICVAVGHSGVLTDSETLHFKPMRIRVAVEADKSGQYGDQNRIKGYEGLSSQPAAFANASSAPQEQAPGRPWQQTAAR